VIMVMNLWVYERWERLDWLKCYQLLKKDSAASGNLVFYRRREEKKFLTEW